MIQDRKIVPCNGPTNATPNKLAYREPLQCVFYAQGTWHSPNSCPKG